MARGSTVQHIRKAGAFTNGQLFAGEFGLDVTNGVWYFSRNGTTVEVLSTGGGASNLDGLTDVTLSALAAGHVIQYDATTSQWVNRTLATAGILDTAQKGAANGLATLGADGKVPNSQMGALSLTSVSVVATEAAMLALAAQAGDFAIRSDTGVTFVHNGGTAGTVADWTLLPANDTSVDASHIVAGDLGAARYSANIGAALNAAPAAVTINNPNITIDAGTL